MSLFARTVLAAAALSATASTGLSATEYTFGGTLTDAQNLAFAVINGSLRSQSPQPGDLPLGFTGSLTIDEANGFAQFTISGSFTSPTRSYVFDLVSPNIIAGLQAGSASTVTFVDVFDDFDVSLSIDLDANTGSFSILLPDAVPSVPPEDRSATGSIDWAAVTGDDDPVDDPADPIAIGFQAIAVDVNDPLGAFTFGAHAAATGLVTLDATAINLLGVSPGSPGLFELDALSAIVSGDQVFNSVIASGLVQDNVPNANGTEVVDVVTLGASTLVELPGEFVFGQILLVLTGDADWLDGVDALPAVETLGLENANSAQLVVTVPDTSGFDPGNDNDGDGVPDTLDDGSTITSVAVFDVVSLLADGVEFKRFDGGIDLVAGDTNGDRVVNTADLLALLANFGSTDANLAQGELNGDGVVDTADLLLLLSTFGTSS